jgi:signal transduction histidine kinase
VFTKDQFLPEGFFEAMRRIVANLRLRTKFLLSIVMVVAGLTWFSLYIVRATVERRAHGELTANARNSLVMFDLLQKQQRAIMSRKADLLATVAFLSNNDATEFQDSADNPLDSQGVDLMVMADAGGQVSALHATNSKISRETVQTLLQDSLSRGRTSDWWLANGRLYEVELQPIGPQTSPKLSENAMVVVGRNFDYEEVHALGRLLDSEVALRYQGHTVVSTLDPFREKELENQLADGKTADNMSLGMQRYFASSVELTPGAADGVSITVLKSDEETLAFLHRINAFLLRLGFVAILAGGILAFVMSHTFTEPLDRLVQGVQALERGDYSYTLNVNDGGEVAQVTKAFLRMRQTLQNNEAERQRLEDQLRQSQKMEALGRLAGGVAHDFNNLLTIIKGHSDLLLDWLRSSDAPYKSCQQINKAADRASALTRQLLVFSRKQVLQPRILDLNVLVTETDKLLERLIREDVEFHFIPGASLANVKADPCQLEQVLLNLTVNACDAMPTGGKLTIETRNLVVDQEYAQDHPGLRPGSYVLLSATDTGHGMDAATKARIFEPFFTTKEVGKGTGLGLATVYGIVQQSGGFICVESEVGRGTRFEVYLPSVAENRIEEVAPMQRKNPEAPVKIAPTVLIAEDDAAVRELASRFLDQAGYRVITAKDGMEAIQLAKDCGQPIGALLTDVVMPNMRGPELASQIRELLPGTAVVFMSGYLEHNGDSQEMVANGMFLEKPFTRAMLLERIAEAVSAPRNSHAKPLKGSSPVISVS